MSERPTHAWCPACREESAIDRHSRCLWCDGETTSVVPAKRGGWKRLGLRGTRYTEAQLRALHVAHMKGASINALAKQTYARVGYKTHGSAATAISREWKNMGLRARDRIEQTVLSSTKHGRKRRNVTNAEQTAYRRWLAEQRGWRSVHGPGQPRCNGVRLQHPRLGEPCERPAQEGSEFCLSHDPERRGEVVRIVERAREQLPERPSVPIGPFQAFLEMRRLELGSQRAVAKATGLSISMVSAHRRAIDAATKRPKSTITIDVVRRCLEHDGTMTFEELYAGAMELAA